MRDVDRRPAVPLVVPHLETRRIIGAAAADADQLWIALSHQLGHDAGIGGAAGRRYPIV